MLSSTRNPLPDGKVPERKIELTYPLDEAQSESENTGSAPVESTVNESGNVNKEQDIVTDGIKAHGVLWKNAEVLSALNGRVQTRLWSVSGPDRKIVTEGNMPMTMKPLDCFQWTFPMSFLSSIVHNTNGNLCSNHLRAISSGEILKFFGILLLMTRFSFGSRRDLWSRGSKHRYIPAPQFCRFMPFKRLEELRKHISFCAIGEENVNAQSGIDDIRGEPSRWNLCEGFLNAINTHREQNVKPCEYICINESISRWYEKGGSWLSKGLPHYVAIDRKPEHGCEIQSSACGRSGIAIRLAFVKSALMQRGAWDSHLNIGTICLQRLCAPWIGTQRIICADSYFASVEAATELCNNDTRFIGVIKNSTKKSPLRALADFEMSGRGDKRTMVADIKSEKGETFQMMAVSWVDRTRRYFVSTAGKSVCGNPQERIRWTPSSSLSERGCGWCVPKVC